MVARRCRWEEFLETTKPFEISKHDVVRAWQLVKANKGAHGVDGETIEQFESDLKNSLYKIWNRMSSGSYFPPAVKTVAIPKKAGGERKLGIPTVSDRVAQMVVKLHFEPLVEPCFHPDSYGYRPNKSAHQALDITRRRCWRYDWVLEFDIKGLFDNIDHELLMKAVRRHTNNRWLTLYIERWLTAPIQQEDGTIIARKRGVPQGGVISPVLSNLFMHYAFDKWMERNCPAIPFCRYADDGLAHCCYETDAKALKEALEARLRDPLIHCQTRQEAESVLELVRQRLKACGLTLHPEKTKLVYCMDEDRPEKHENMAFDFLGYTFRPRLARNRYGRFFVSFLPGISKASAQHVRDTIKELAVPTRRSLYSLDELAKLINPYVQGWINYYGKFSPSELKKVLNYVEATLVRWAMGKYKKLRGRKKRASRCLGRVAKRAPMIMAHWRFGCVSPVG